MGEHAKFCTEEAWQRHNRQRMKLVIVFTVGGITGAQHAWEDGTGTIFRLALGIGNDGNVDFKENIRNATSRLCK